MRVIKSNRLTNRNKMTILVVDDSLSSAEYPEWVVFEINPTDINPEELAATSLGFATGTSYDSFFKQGAKILDSSDEYTHDEIDAIYEEIEDYAGKYVEFNDLMEYLGWSSVDKTYILSDLAREYD